MALCNVCGRRFTDHIGIQPDLHVFTPKPEYIPKMYQPVQTPPPPPPAPPEGS